MKTDETKGEKPPRIKLRRAGRKLVRVDKPDDPAPGAQGKVEAVEGKGRLVGLILRAIRSDPADRRRDFRHEAAGREVWVGWWTGDDFGAVAGRLLNISRGGAQLVLSCRPPKKQPVWVYKELGETLASVRGEVVGQSPAPGGSYSLRFRFESPCPTVLCEAVLCHQS
jgi:PilZ domain